MTDYEEFLESIGLDWSSAQKKVPQFSDFIEFCQFLLRKHGDGPLRYTEDAHDAERADLTAFWEIDDLAVNLSQYDKSAEDPKYFIGG
mgnify:CR=1 FL=1